MRERLLFCASGGLSRVAEFLNRTAAREGVVLTRTQTQETPVLDF